MKALRILVAEDDTIVGMLLGELLKEMGHDVCAIETTEADAVAAAVRCRPDLMIIDVRLGDGSGISAVKEILRTGPFRTYLSAAIFPVFGCLHLIR
jgi:two-component system, response regulator PdtaR